MRLKNSSTHFGLIAISLHWLVALTVFGLFAWGDASVRSAAEDGNIGIVDHIDEAIAEADVIYMEPVVQPDYTQARQEKQEVYARTSDKYQVTSAVMERAKGSSIILHSLPRRDELLPEVDDSRHARYWQEAYYGVVMRMALLSLVLGAMGL